jgi:hypothetical protein
VQPERKNYLKLQINCTNSVPAEYFALESFVVAGNHREPVSSAKTGPQERSISDGMQGPGMLAPKPEAGATQKLPGSFFCFGVQ